MFFNWFTSRRTPSEAAVSERERINVAQLIEVCDRAASGDLEARLVGIPADDGLAPVGKAINRMLDSLDAYVREASAAMEHCSQGRFHRPILLRGLPGALRKSALVINQAALKMKKHSAQIDTFEIQRKEIVENVRLSIGAACEELSATASEISRQATQSTSLISSTVKEAEAVQQSVAELTEAAATIEGIVQLITDLARQTTMIALNANIEAARAGDHGRGFAVVADEVKTLARNTGQATVTIAKHVSTINQSIVGVERAIKGIVASIHTVNTNAAVIDSSVGEQVQATEEIAKQIAAVADAISAPVGDLR